MTAADRALAERLVQAEKVGDADTAMEVLNDVADRLDLPLDHTEQGLTPWASEQVDAFVKAALR